MMISAETKQAILELQTKYPYRRSALIPALHMVQSEVGYLPIEVQQEVAALFDLPVTEISAIVTFYDLFFDKPAGKHHIHMCKNLSCMLRGSDALLETMCEKLQIRPGETSADGEFTLLASECLGACDRAPMMILDEEVIGPIQEEEIDSLLKSALERSPHG